MELPRRILLQGVLILTALRCLHDALTACLVPGSLLSFLDRHRPQQHRRSSPVARQAVVRKWSVADLDDARLDLKNKKVVSTGGVSLDGEHASSSDDSSPPRYVRPARDVILPWVQQNMPNQNKEGEVIEQLKKQCRELVSREVEGTLKLMTHRRALRRLLAFCSCSDKYEGQSWQEFLTKMSPKFPDRDVMPNMTISQETLATGERVFILTCPYGDWNKGFVENFKTAGPSFEREMTGGLESSMRWYRTHSFSLGELEVLVRSEADAFDAEGNVVELKTIMTSRKRPFDLDGFLTERGLSLLLQMLLGGAELVVIGAHRVIDYDTSVVHPNAIHELSIRQVKERVAESIIAEKLLGRAASILASLTQTCNVLPPQQRFRVEFDRQDMTVTLHTEE
mmetsp:Transcript_63144/g.175055  ORF Transcript_63144/g.175055 Transcript_63144/m.175055 type:complete len:396 (-) Transcript_63144:145-1332(-)